MIKSLKWGALLVPFFIFFIFSPVVSVEAVSLPIEQGLNLEMQEVIQDKALDVKTEEHSEESGEHGAFATSFLSSYSMGVVSSIQSRNVSGSSSRSIQILVASS